MKTSAIDRIESEGNYVRIHSDRGVVRTRLALNAVESGLDPSQFVRVHRCNIVNVDRISAVEVVGTGDHTLHLEDGSTVPVARSRRQQLFKALGGKPGPEGWELS